MEIKIRYNTDKDKIDSSLPAWRILVDNKEYLAEQVRIETPSWTTQDLIAQGTPNEALKWHITCKGNPVWDEARKVCKIVPEVSAVAAKPAR